MKSLKPLFLIFSFLISTAFFQEANASLYNLDVTWSGASFGNTATAEAIIVFESSLVPILGSDPNISIPSNEISDLSITVTGASAGNGSFNISDFSVVLFSTPSQLDLSSQLIGQSLSNGSTYGTSTGSLGDGLGGDFNLVGYSSEAPNGSWYFELTTNNGNGDRMLVTSMLATPIPEPVPLPPSIWLFGTSLLGFLGLKRRKH